MKPARPIRRGKRPRPRSAKREGQRDERAAVVAAVFRRDGGRCAARDRLPHQCSGQLDCHEIIPRSAWAAGYLVAENCMLVCRAAHDWIGDHPAAAHEVGLHGFSYERPDAHGGSDEPEG